MGMTVLMLVPVLVIAIAITMIGMAIGYSIAFIIWVTATALRLVIRPEKVKITVHPPVKPIVNEYWYPQSVKVRLDRGAAYQN